MKKKEDISDTEKKLWEEYLKNPKDLFDKELESKKKFNQAERYRFDLHGFTLLEANKKVRELIIYCQKNNFKEISLSVYLFREYLYKNVLPKSYRIITESNELKKKIIKLYNLKPNSIISIPNLPSILLKNKKLLNKKKIVNTYCNDIKNKIN